MVKNGSLALDLEALKRHARAERPIELQLVREATRLIEVAAILGVICGIA